MTDRGRVSFWSAAGIFGISFVLLFSQDPLEAILILGIVLPIAAFMAVGSVWAHDDAAHYEDEEDEFA